MFNSAYHIMIIIIVPVISQPKREWNQLCPGQCTHWHAQIVETFNPLLGVGGGMHHYTGIREDDHGKSLGTEEVGKKLQLWFLFVWNEMKGIPLNWWSEFNKHDNLRWFRKVWKNLVWFFCPSSKEQMLSSFKRKHCSFIVCCWRSKSL